MKLLSLLSGMMAVTLVLSMANVTAYANSPPDGAIKELESRLRNPNEIQHAPFIEPEPPQPPESPPQGEYRGGHGGGFTCNSLCQWYKQYPNMRKQCFSDLAEELKPKISEDMKLMDIFPSLSNPNYWLCSGDMWGIFKPFF